MNRIVSFWSGSASRAETPLLRFVDMCLCVILTFAMVGFAILLNGCASVPRPIAEQGQLKADLSTHLGGCVDGDHACRCFWVQSVIRACVSKGYERHCADDFTEM